MEYILLVVGFVLLVKGADFFVEGSSSVAKRLRVPSVIIGLTIVAFGTSAPEMAVSISASIAGSNDIAVGNDIINYFAYQESLDYLTKQDSIRMQKQENGSSYYALTETGMRIAKELRNYVGKAYRDKLVSAALHYFARIKRESEVKIDYIPLEKGYYVHVRCLDVQDDLLD